jgi:group I intron endonuclease
MLRESVSTTQYVVYLLTFPNGKKYVGITNNWAARWRNYKNSVRNGDRRAVCCALRKYGVTAVTVDFIKESNNVTETKTLEKFFIQKFKTLAPTGYNMTEGGDGMLGWKVTDETRSKMSIAKKGKKLSEEHRKKLSVAHSNPSEEARRRMSYAGKGKSKSEEHRLKISISNTGRRHSPETIEKIKLAAKNRKKHLHSKETLNKFRQIAAKRSRDPLTGLFV